MTASPLAPTPTRPDHRGLAVVALIGLIAAAVAVLLAPPADRAGAAPGDPILPTHGRRTISGEFETTCVIVEAGTLQCWGEGGGGQIGDGASVDRPRPTPVAGLTDVIDVSAGDDTTCAVDADHDLWCWGSDSNGELGDGPGGTEPDTPQQVPGMAGTRDVTAGYDHVCAAKLDGTAWCWGEGDGNELATGTPDDETAPFQIPGITDAVATAVSEQGSCVLHDDGTVSCWGNNNSGEVGDGTDVTRETPVEVLGVTGAIDIEKTDDYATCALIDDGTIDCWGDGGSDWLPQTNTAVTLPGITDAVAMRVSDRTICAVRADFSVACAGGRTDTLPGDIPAGASQVVGTGLAGVADLTLGDYFGCAVLATGEVECWGDNGRSGRLGIGADSEVDPVRVPALEGATAVDAGADTTCAIAGGELWCWGANSDRFIAVTDDPFIAEPTQVGTANDLVDVSLGNAHGCVLDDDDEVACWGENNDGRLGVGDQNDRATPTAVSNGTYLAVSAGRDHTCAIGTNDAAVCWGSDSNGQIGSGAAAGGVFVTPTLIDSPAIDFTSIDAGDFHSCGTQANDKVRCWGLGTDGQLGDGTATSGAGSTVLVDDATDDFGLVAAGDDSTCATRASGIACWGRNWTVDGLSSTDQQDTPQDKTIGSTWTAIDMENEHACAIQASDSAVYCWGRDSDGQLTSAVSGFTYEPTAAVGLGKAVDITVGDEHSCAIIDGDDEVWCWGGNDNAQAGEPSFFESPTPVPLDGGARATVDVEPPPTTTAPPTTSPPTPGPGPAPAPVDVFVPVEPARLVDTRTTPTSLTIDGQQQGIGRLAAGEQITVDVAGVSGRAARAGVPAGAQAVIVNITAITPSGVGFVTAHPCLSPRPLASSLNYTAGVTLGNEVIAELSGAGTTCLYTSAETDLAVDVVAYLPAGSDYSAIGPTRFADTRTDGSADTFDGGNEADGTRSPGSTYRVRIAGRGGVDADAVAAVMNVTAIRPATVGFLTVHPCAPSLPNAASLNYVPGTNRGNEIVAPLSPDGDICIFTSSTTDLAVDVVGQITGSSYSPIEPERFADTRTDGSADTIDGESEATGRIAPGQTLVVQVGGRGSVPANAVTVTLNVTSVQPLATGFITAHPCLAELPTAASLNYVPGVNGGNEILAQLDGEGRVCFFSSADTHLTVDIAGFTD